MSLALSGRERLVAWADRGLRVAGYGPERCLLVLGVTGDVALARRAARPSSYTAGCAILERQKGRNLSRDPRTNLLVIDPRNGRRWIELRGRVVKLTTNGAEALADKLAQRYLGKQHFYGDAYPAAPREQ